MQTTIIKSRWGWIGLAATDRGVAAVVLPKRSRRAVERQLKRTVSETPSPVPSPANGARATFQDSAPLILAAARKAISTYLAGRPLTADLPLDLDRHPRFSRRVWEVLRTIPYGRVRAYGWVARKVGKPRAARAVGGACRTNPVPLFVPCHRIIAGDGSLGGFSGGLPVKKRLLRLEGLRVR
jgi:methylated-DNA-[protein]-cysteine S-methyltransferase